MEREGGRIRISTRISSQVWQKYVQVLNGSVLGLVAGGGLLLMSNNFNLVRNDGKTLVVLRLSR